MRCVLLWTHLSLLLVLILDSTHLTASYCPNQHCGNISIRYPFGIGKGCYLNGWFEIQCNNSTSGKLVPYLPKINKEVVRIYLRNPYAESSFSTNSVHIKTKITSMGCSNSSSSRDRIKFGEPLNFTGIPFAIAASNKLIAIGCNNKATLTHLEPRLVGCITNCERRKKGDDDSGCIGNKCCQADQPSGASIEENPNNIIGVSIEDTRVSIEENPNNITRGKECRVAFLTDELLAKNPNPQWYYNRQYVTLLILWAFPMTNLSFIKSLGCKEGYLDTDMNDTDSCACDINNLFTGIGCVCTSGYTGNPYILGGCKGFRPKTEDTEELKQVKPS